MNVEQSSLVLQAVQGADINQIDKMQVWCGRETPQPIEIDIYTVVVSR